MINVLIIFLVISFIVAIIVLKGSHDPSKGKSRGDFLKELTTKLEGRIEETPECPDGYRVRFRSQGREFVFEDVFTVGFTTDKLNKAFLKIQLNSTLSVTFSERKAKSGVRSDIMMTSKIPDKKIISNEVDVPAGLREFIVHTNNIPQANAFFADPKVERIFMEFKNMDSRGYPLMALKIIDGQVILEYQPIAHFRPSLKVLNENPQIIEDHAAKLLLVAKKAEQIAL